MKENNLDKLFELARKNEPEVTKDTVISFVSKISESEIKNGDNPKQSLFSLKNILMSSILVFIGSLLFFVVNNQVSNPENQISEIELIEELDQLELIEHEIHLADFDLESHFIASTNIQEVTPGIELKSKKPIDQETQSKVIEQERNEPRAAPTQSKNPQRSTGSIKVFPSENNKIKMTSWDLIKLKRTLIKNLVKDKLIASKYSEVEIQLKERSIIVNGHELNVNQFTKYRNLTSQAGWGEKRKIIMNQQNIRVGDFEGLNFKGVGLGRFYETNEIPDITKEHENQKVEKHNNLAVFEKEKTERQKNEEKVEEETKALNKIVEEIYSDSGPFRKSFFYGNKFKEKDMRAIHTGIYKQLADSKLKYNYQSLIVLELKENQLILNGEELDSDIEIMLNDFLSEFNFKRKDFRMIKLTEHSIAIGDYRPGSFTGAFHFIF